MPVLGWSYHLLRGRYRRFGAIRAVRAALGWGAAMPFAYLCDTARPLPTPQVLHLIDALEGPIAVGPCRCRAAHQGCDHPLESDLVIRTGVEAGAVTLLTTGPRAGPGPSFARCTSVRIEERHD